MQHTGTIRIYMFDDNHYESFLFKMVAKRLLPDLEVTEYRTERALLEAITTSDTLPHLVFLNHQMPQLNGIRCVKELRSDERYKDITLVLYTDESNDAYVKEAHAAGATYYILKPHTIESIEQVLLWLINTADSTIPTPIASFFLTEQDVPFLK